MSSSDASSRKGDPGWKYGVPGRPDNPKDKSVRCFFCDKITKGGIYRHKQHLAGGFSAVLACNKCPEHVRTEIREFMSKKKEVKASIDSFSSNIDLFDEDLNEEMDEGEAYDLGLMPMPQSKSKGKESISSSSSLKRAKTQHKGPMDLYLSPQMKKKNDQKGKQHTLDECTKELRSRMVQCFAKWMYDAGIPFNAVRYPSFANFIDATTRCPTPVKPPSYHEVRVPYLAKEMENTQNLLLPHQKEWAKIGCSIMSDAWRDRKGRCLINILVNCPRGSMFLNSTDASSYAKTGERMYEMLAGYVESVGTENVVQVVTDNASEMVLAGKMLMAKFPHLYWTPCAAHCIDLMLEDIFKLPHFKKTIKRAMEVNAYIYNHTLLLNMMRKFTNQREMVRAGVTRFATAFLTLKRFHTQKANLKKLFTSDEFNKSRFAKEKEGKQIAQIMLMPSFWNHLTDALKIAGPICKVLRIVDGEKKPAMGYIYEAMDRAKEAIVNSFHGDEKKYKRIFEIIDARWDIQLHQPLHAAAYYLNPEFFYSNPKIEQDSEVIKGLFDCIQRLVPSPNIQDKITMELTSYRKAEGFLGSPLAMRQRDQRAPADWWETYGSTVPNLQQFAVRILSLTCSSSGCERNWSVFEHLHSKKRNRLEQKRLDQLVYIKYNRALIRRYNMRHTIDPIALDQIDESNEWLIGYGIQENEEDELVFEDDDLTWGDVARASGVEESIYKFRSQNKVLGNKEASSSARSRIQIGIEEVTPINKSLYDSEEEELDFEEENDETREDETTNLDLDANEENEENEDED